MKLLCRLGWHDWTRFGLPKETYGNLSQFRECKHCCIINSKEGYHEQAKAKSIVESLIEGRERDEKAYEESGNKISTDVLEKQRVGEE